MSACVPTAWPTFFPFSTRTVRSAWRAYLATASGTASSAGSATTTSGLAGVASSSATRTLRTFDTWSLRFGHLVPHSLRADGVQTLCSLRRLEARRFPAFRHGRPRKRGDEGSRGGRVGAARRDRGGIDRIKLQR